MAKFMIVVDYDQENIEVNSIKINGGFVQPSLEMYDLLSDVQNLLNKEVEGNIKGYYKKIKPKKKAAA